MFTLHYNEVRCGISVIFGVLYLARSRREFAVIHSFEKFEQRRHRITVIKVRSSSWGGNSKGCYKESEK